MNRSDWPEGHLLFLSRLHESNQCCFLSLPHLCWLSTHHAFISGVLWRQGVFQICTDVCTLGQLGCPPQHNPSQERNPCCWSEDKGGRVLISFSFFFFFCLLF